MNLSDVPAVTETQEIERSLDLLMTEIVRLDLMPRRDRDLPPQGGAQSMGDLMKAWDENQQRTKAGRFAHKIASDPVREALCHAVRQLGTRLHEIGGVGAMSDACDRQEDRPEGMRRISIIDKRWDGIGTTATTAGWCA